MSQKSTKNGGRFLPFIIILVVMIVLILAIPPFRKFMALRKAEQKLADNEVTLAYTPAESYPDEKALAAALLDLAIWEEDMADKIDDLYQSAYISPLLDLESYFDIGLFAGTQKYEMYANAAISRKSKAELDRNTRAAIESIFTNADADASKRLTREMALRYYGEDRFVRLRRMAELEADGESPVNINIIPGIFADNETCADWVPMDIVNALWPDRMPRWMADYLADYLEDVPDESAAHRLGRLNEALWLIDLTEGRYGFSIDGGDAVRDEQAALEARVEEEKEAAKAAYSRPSSSGGQYWEIDPDDYDLDGYYEDYKDDYDNYDDAYDDFMDDVDSWGDY